MSFLSRSILAAIVAFLPTFSNASEQLSLAQISAYLNSLTTLKSDFRQINDDRSVSTGTLYIERPGRMRFEYDPPEQALVIASTGAVFVIDRKSNQVPETYPLSRTPLSLILGRNIDLTRDNLVRQSVFDGKYTVVTAADPKERESGYIEMSFADNPTQLRQWVIHDATGSQTTVILGQIKSGVDLPRSLFNADLERQKNDR